MNFRRFLLIPLMTGALTLGQLAAPADSIEPWRIVVRVDGKVGSKSPGQDDYSPIWRSRVLTDGDWAKTGQDSQARIKLADQSEFTIGSDTVVEMTKFQLTPEGRTVVFNLTIGKIRARVAKALGKQSKFEVKTPNGVLAARGTDFYVQQFKDEKAARLLESAGIASRTASDIVADAGTNGLTFFEVYSGRVQITNSAGRSSFAYRGDGGIITTFGVIHVNPTNFQVYTGQLPRSGSDAEMRQPGPGERSPEGGGTGPTGRNEAPDNPLGGDTSSGTTHTDTQSSSATAPPPIYAPSSTETTKTGTVPIIITK